MLNIRLTGLQNIKMNKLTTPYKNSFIITDIN